MRRTRALLLAAVTSSSGCLMIQQRYSVVDASGPGLLAGAAAEPSSLAIMVAAILGSAALGAFLLWAIQRWHASRKVAAERDAAERTLAQAGKAAVLACDLSATGPTDMNGQVARSEESVSAGTRSV